MMGIGMIVLVVDSARVITYRIGSHTPIARSIGANDSMDLQWASIDNGHQMIQGLWLGDS